MKLLFLFICLLMGSCSSVEQISANAHGIRESATATLGHLNTIKDIGSDEVLAEVGSAESEQENIIVLAEGIKRHLPNVRDAVPWWASLISRVMTAGSIIGVAFLCWYLGIGALTKRVFWSLGMFIPKTARRAAEMDLKVERNEVSMREAIAARRAADPAYESARKQAKKKKGKA